MGVLTKSKWSVSALFAFVFALPSVFAYTIDDAFASFVGGFQGFLSGGDISALAGGILDIIPIIGLFLIVFGLMFYLSKITIFRGEDTDRYARWLALGIGLVGVVQQSVFNVILGWGTLFLTFAFITLLIFMGIIFVNRNRQSHFEAATDMRKEQATFYSEKGKALTAKQDLLNVQKSLSMDEKNYQKIERDLSSLDSSLQNISELAGDELGQVDHLADLLRKATAAAEQNEANKMHGYLQALSRDLASLITKMKHEDSVVRSLESILHDIHKRTEFIKNDLKKDYVLENHMKTLFEKHAQSVSGTSHLDDIEKKLLQESHDVQRILRHMLQSIEHLLHLEMEVQKHYEELQKYGYRSKHSAAAEVRDAVLTQDFTQAHTNLDHLRSLIEHERKKIQAIRHIESDVKRHVTSLHLYERKLTVLIKEMIQQIEAEKKKQQ